jgi:glycosyltransferase involved in cell wall biosynthesis
MACGTPVITSNVTSLPEVAGDAAIMVTPGDKTELADAMKRVLTDTGLAANMTEYGYTQAASFTWDKAARNTMKVFSEVVGHGI